MKSTPAAQSLVRHVRFTPKSRHVQCTSRCPLCANSGHEVVHSTTLSARASNVGGTVSAERFRGFQIDRQFVFFWCRPGQITRFFSRREQAAQPYQIKIGNRSIFVSYSCSARKVSQLATFPDFKPVMNQRVRCSEEPCVNASGTT